MGGVERCQEGHACEKGWRLNMLSFRSHSRTPALKTENFNRKFVVLVKRRNGFAKTIPWTENARKMRRRAL